MPFNLIPGVCCTCSGGVGCGCLVEAGANTTVDGTGTEGDPFIISAAAPGAAVDGPQIYGFASTAGGIVLTGGHLVLPDANLAYLNGGAAAYTFDIPTSTITIVEEGIYSLNFGGQTKTGATYAAIEATSTHPLDLTDSPTLVLLPPGLLGVGLATFSQAGWVIKFAAGDTLVFTVTPSASPSDVSYFSFRLMKI